MLSSRFCSLAIGVALAATLFAPPASAGDSVAMSATGTVAFATVPSGPLAPVSANDAVTMTFEVEVPGFVSAPGQYENYHIIPSSFTLDFGSASIGVGPNVFIGLQNNFPVADGVHLFTSPLSVSGHFMEFELFDATGGNIFDSTDAESESGSYGPELFQKAAWNIFMGGGQIAIQFEQLVIGGTGPVGEWIDLENALAGTHGLPVLSGSGDQIAGLPVTVSLTNALENTSAHLLIGLSTAFVSLEGGTLVPFPDILISPLPTGPSGQIIAGGNWPAGVPSGFRVYYQYWIDDPAGPFGYSASNGLQSITP